MRGKVLSLQQPLVMAILNSTPDSFYAASRVTARNLSPVLSRVESLIAQGADILDIGGYSTRPGAKEVETDEELARILPVITHIHKHFPDTLISVDTFRSKVAEAAIQSGAHLINDVSGGNLDDKMFETVARLQVPYVLMHMRGTPKTMSQMTEYASFPGDVLKELQSKAQRLKEMGVSDIIIDPGFGFSKTPDQNFSLIANLALFRSLGHPLLVGVSRKSTVFTALNTTPDQALNGTTVLNTASLLHGANILRVHDVKEAREAVILTERLRKVKL